MTHQEVRERLDALRHEFKSANCDRQNEIQAEIAEIIPQLSKVDRKVEKLKAKQKALKESDPRMAELIKMDRYILKSTKHIKHLIQATQEQDCDLEHEHYLRLRSRYQHLSEMIEEYDKNYRK